MESWSLALRIKCQCQSQSNHQPLDFLCFSVPNKAPSGVRVRSIEFTSDLLVEWNPLPKYYANGIVVGYTISYKESSSLSPYKSVNTSINNVNPTKFTLKDLKPAREYLIAVAAFTSIGVGPSSDLVLATTGTLLNYWFAFNTWLTVSLYYLGAKK